jgi:hypothetical protein
MAADPLPMQIILLGMLIGVASAVSGLSARVDALEHDRLEPAASHGTLDPVDKAGF